MTVMANLPPVEIIAGPFTGAYEQCWKGLEPARKGAANLPALDAAKFLKKSKLDDLTLSKIWDIADIGAKGSLTRSEFFIALKLVALAQAGQLLTLNGACVNAVPAPVLEGVPPMVAVVSQPSANSPFAMTPQEKAKYEEIFKQLQPVNGKVTGLAVRPVFLKSGLTTEVLGKIWDLSDIDQDGNLDIVEFRIAMHLVARAMVKVPIPNKLPPELVPPSVATPHGIDPETPAPPGVSSPISATPAVLGSAAGLKSRSTTFISEMDWTKYTELFRRSDLDRDGFVSGNEIKPVFLQSGLPMLQLAKIWNLADTDQSGKLSLDQFILAMWLVSQRLAGKEIPEVLPLDIRNNIVTTASLPPHGNAPPRPPTPEPAGPTFTNPELETLHEEILESKREAAALEKDLSEREAQLKLRNGEIRTLGTELETLQMTFQQLNNQKGEAQRRLDDLDSQLSKLKLQADDQEKSLKEQEDVLFSKKKELETLRVDEQDLENRLKEESRNRERMEKDLLETAGVSDETQMAIQEYSEAETQMTEALSKFDTVADVLSIPEPFLQDIPQMAALMSTKEDRGKGMNLMSNHEEADPFAGGGGSHVDPFRGHDPFSEQDPFQASSGGDPFSDGPPSDPFGGGSFAESPTPALPPKSKKAPPPRPAPPKKAPAKPPPPSVSPSADPFASAGESGGGGFADFAAFDSAFGSSSSAADDPWK